MWETWASPLFTLISAILVIVNEWIIRPEKRQFEELAKRIRDLEVERAVMRFEIEQLKLGRALPPLPAANYPQQGPLQHQHIPPPAQQQYQYVPHPQQQQGFSQPQYQGQGYAPLPLVAGALLPAPHQAAGVPPTA